MARQLDVKERKVIGLTEKWLHGEHEYQFNKNRITHNANPITSRHDILMTEIPNKWHRFQHFRSIRVHDQEFDPKAAQDPKLLMQVGQNILKCAAAARGAFVWAEVDANNLSVEEASQKSWDTLEEFKDRLLNQRYSLPSPSLLRPGMTPESAIKDYSRNPYAYGKPTPTFVGMTALAITAVLEQSPKDTIVLPEPGVTSGELKRWDA